MKAEYIVCNKKCDRYLIQETIEQAEECAESMASISGEEHSIFVEISRCKPLGVEWERNKFAQIQAANPETNTLPDYILF